MPMLRVIVSYVLVFGLVFSSMAWYGGDWQRVRERIGIFKGENATSYQRLSIVYKAVVVAEPLEYLGVDEASRAEPATVEVNPGDVTSSGTHVHDLNSVGRYATRERSCGSLTYHNISACTLFSDPARFFHCQRCANKVKGKLFIKFHDSESYAFFLNKKNVATRLAASLKRDVNSTNWPTKRESWKDKKYFLEANHRNYVREEQRKLTHDHPSFIQSSMLPFPVHKNWKFNQPELLAQNNLLRHCSQIFKQKG